MVPQQNSTCCRNYTRYVAGPQEFALRTLAARPGPALDCRVLLLALAPLLYGLGSLVEAALHAPAGDEWAPAVLFRRLLLGLLLAGWLGVTLAEGGRFSAPLLLALLASTCALLAGWVLWRGEGARGLARALGRAGAPGRRAEWAALLALLALAAGLYWRPGEDVLGARDPGIYFATGAAIARQGAVLQDDPTLRALAADLGDASINYWLFQSVHGWELRFPGQLFVRDLAAGTVEPGFLPWYPAAIALAVGAGGLAAGLWVNPLLATLALLAVYFAGRRLVGPPAAALGAGLLAADLGQVWFARYTMAEPAAQLLAWTGLYALAAAQRRPSPALGLLAGLAWGSTLLARVDSVLLVPPVVGYLVWQARAPERRRYALPALGAVGLLALQFVWHAWRLAPGYHSMVFSGATLAVAAGGIALTLTAAGGVWLLAAAPRPAGRDWRPALALAVVGLAALFAYLVRPLLPAPALGGESAALEAAARESLVRLGWYVTPLGLALALAGAALLLRGSRWQPALPVLGLLGLSLAFYLPNPLVSSDQPWAARRYLPVVLPGLLLVAAYGAAAIGSWLGRGVRAPRGVGTGLAGLLCLAVAAGEWRATTPVAAYREHAGTVAQIEALAALFPPDAIVLFPRSAAGMRLSLPLQYLGDRAAFVLPAEEPVEGVLSVVRRWRAEDRPVYWVVPLGTRFPTPAGVRFAPAGQFAFETAQLERPLDRLPTHAEALRFDLQLYRIDLVPPPSAP